MAGGAVGQQSSFASGRAGRARHRALWFGLSLLWAVPTQAATTITRNSAFDYDATSGLLTKEIVEQANSTLCTVTAYTLDANTGVRTVATTRNCNGSAGTFPGAVTEAAAPTGVASYTGTTVLTDTAVFTQRQTTSTYDADKRFVEQVKNALNQTETRVYDKKLGLVTSLTGPNQLTTLWAYDGFGRKTLEQRPDGNGTKWEYQYCSGVYGGSLACPSINGAAGAYAITTTPVASANVALNTTGAANGPYVRVYYDALGREIRSETQGDESAAASRLIYVDTKYNALGQIYQKSAPYYNGDTAYWTTFTYDQLGRVTQEDRPTDTAASGAVTKITYNGLVTITEVQINATTWQKTTEERNLVGQVAKVTDHKGGVLVRDYDPTGNLVRTVDANGNATGLEYDTKGRKTKMLDPDMGMWTYAYNALGELRKQLDAKAQLTEMSYDVLGRLLKRGEPGLVSTWSYDTYADGTACTGKGIGKLCEATADNGYKRRHAYDSLGRPSSTTTTIGTTVYTASIAYDTNGRVASQTYPGGLSVTNVYSTIGYLKQVKDGRTGGATLWTATANRTALGLLKQYQYGNAVSTTNEYYAPTGRLNTTKSGTGDGVQNLGHTYNYIGGLTTRIDSLTQVTASYGYDDLRRLTSETRQGGGLAAQQVIGWDYDAIGNIKTRTDDGVVKTYTYNPSGAVRPHAVTAITGTVNGVANPTYVYDANGNMTSSAGRTVTWTGYDKVASITKGTVQLAYQYDSEHERAKETYTLNGAVQRTTLYLNPQAGAGLFYEEESGVAGTKKKFYVSAPSGTVALITCTVADCTVPANTTTQYWHKDHLGSTSVITNAAGAVIERLAYEPFGKRRNSNGVTDPNGTLVAVNTDRGFTGHEHIEELGLINMNGRVFDPGIGRFMSADPSIQSPGALQSYNRYSYVWNDPLNATDPTGYKKMWQAQWFRQVVAIVVAAYTGVYMQPTWVAVAGSSFGGAVLGGTVAGFASGAITSGTLKGAVNGAAGGALFGAIGASGWSDGWMVAAHALAGCATAELGGGDCGRGAVIAGASKAAFLYGPDWVKDPTTGGAIDAGKITGGAIYSAAVGGTASILGGGKFANGAQMAAFGYLVNGAASAARAAIPPAGAANAPGQSVIDPTLGDMTVVAKNVSQMLPGGDLVACAATGCTPGEIAAAVAGVVPAGKAAALVFKVHSIRRLERVGLDVREVEAAVAADIAKIPQSTMAVGADFSNRVVVKEVPVIYRARVLPDGSLNVGSIHPDDLRWIK